jgi:hypothetical protein
MISYGIDRHRAAARDDEAGAGAAARHGLAVYVAYVFYPPLYLAGPILPFDDFAAQWARATEGAAAAAAAAAVSAAAAASGAAASGAVAADGAAAARERGAPSPLSAAYVARLAV